MKKNWKRGLVSVLTGAIFVAMTACGGSGSTGTTTSQGSNGNSGAAPQTESPSAPAEKPAAAPLNLTLAGGSSGGSWTAIGEGIGESIRRAFPGSTFSYEPGQDGANTAAVAGGMVALGMAHSPIVKQALNGEEPFKSPLDNVQVVASLYPGLLQVVARQDASFKSIDEIVEKKLPIRVSVNKKGTIQDLIAQSVFEAYGVTYADIESWGGKVLYSSSGESMDLFRDGRLDLYFPVIKAPETYLIETSTSVPLQLIPVKDEALVKAGEQWGMPINTIPAGTYSFLKEDYKTIELYVQLVTSSDVPEETIYQVTKSMTENLDYLKTIHNALAELTPEGMTKTGDMPLHTGAQRLYKEIGVLK
ncbi:TAXI family TRAP transporter solute-binding subunit [Ammoniphilus sp. YIM 78166]|uniref:TAXI family TRAP transporter solute-binding subunit n=1 Tax=Ammoniphilus sp. YIM 78166 TaxID=1644106 RepID=UPI0014301052|nr:TAXI family TRAP transporter solute-binding subunit [Ammoniphilus sp. YIM 78166]